MLLGPQVGDTLADGRYRLGNALGFGGMATVFHAWDERLEVPRAIKILAPHLSTVANVRQRFMDEAKVMARLQCPNLVTVYDVGVEDECIYIALEIMRGGSVADRIKRSGPLPPRMAVNVCVLPRGASDSRRLSGG